MIGPDELGEFNLADENVFDVQGITDAVMSTSQSLTELGIRFFLNLLVCWLLVQFFWPFRGEYWIIELDPDYRYAVVGHPSRDYLWILSRTPRMEEEVYRELLRRIAAHGYDLTRIRRTEHRPA